ncbi:hypothetical protein GGER_33920 [Serratia rubidaea]
MLRQLLRLLRRAVLRQIVRRGAQQVLNLHQSAANQARRWAVGDAQRQIHAVVNQIHIAVFQPQAHVHLGVALQKGRHMRMQHKAADRFRYADADQSFRFGMVLPAEAEHRLGRRQHLPAVLQGALSRFAQAQFTGGAVQQPQPQRLFQLADAAADGRRRRAQPAGGGGETAALGHLDEYGHLGQ